MPRICPGIGPPGFFSGPWIRIFTGCQARIQSNTALPFGEELQEATVDLPARSPLVSTITATAGGILYAGSTFPGRSFRSSRPREFHSVQDRKRDEYLLLGLLRHPVLFHRAYTSSTRINGGEHDLEGQLDNIERGVKVDRDKGLCLC